MAESLFDWGRTKNPRAEARGFATEVIDLLQGEEAGIKSATLIVKGSYAYGYLQGEEGVHRLVRISPFDSNKRRHTSFASVDVVPEADETTPIEIAEGDLRIDVYRSSGKGGQSVNTTDSAVRITHLPTGVVVQCQDERSQLQNKAKALQVLKARLADRERRQREEAAAKEYQSKQKIEWGSQIRSYVLHPYLMVKDHRTAHETGNAQAVLDGALDPFMETYLKWAAAGRPSHQTPAHRIERQRILRVLGRIHYRKKYFSDHRRIQKSQQT
jgi:peptide chain release factor 2